MSTKKAKNGEVVRCNRIYISLRAIGEVDEKEKSVFSIGYNGKIVAEPDRPLSTAVFKLVLHVANIAKYSSQAEADADLKELKYLVDSMKWSEHDTVPSE